MEPAVAVRAFLHALDSGFFGDDLSRVDLRDTAFLRALRALDDGNSGWTRECLAQGLAALDGVTLHEINSTVGPAKDANNWRKYLGRADDLLAHLSAA